MDKRALWKRYQEQLCVCEPIGLTVDPSRMGFTDEWWRSMQPSMARALAAMDELEQGAVANPDERRKVGHYWLRAPELAAPEDGAAIRKALADVKAFAADVHAGRIKPQGAPRFRRMLVIGIGGSALGPQLVADALGSPRDAMAVSFFDNTDPDGFDRVLEALGPHLAETLVVVISKSGGTKETKNGMLEAESAFRRAGLVFAQHAVAVTGEGSELDRVAAAWLRRFPMWDWVGGRTSQTSAVGLLPAALQGIDVDELLSGARAADVLTRSKDAAKNPAALLALLWHHGSAGHGRRDMVVLPYKDRLLLFSRYLQQLVMESLGKELDLLGNPVNQGLTVYGNKGSTDQHAYVQQLRDGVHNFFVVFLEVLKDREGPSLEVEPGVTSGDYLVGFLLGTRAALHEKHRESVTLTVQELSPRSLGALIAVFERAVGLYASLVNVNAYHQPGVEAGKKAATLALALQARALAALSERPRTADELAEAMGAPDEAETVFKLLEHLAANPDRRVLRSPGDSYAGARFSLSR